MDTIIIQYDIINDTNIVPVRYDIIRDLRNTWQENGKNAARFGKKSKLSNFSQKIFYRKKSFVV